jgi:hypothetical protein
VSKIYLEVPGQVAAGYGDSESFPPAFTKVLLMFRWIRISTLLLLCATVASMTGCLIHYHYAAKIIEIRVRNRNDSVRVWSAIEAVVKASGYRLSSGSENSIETRSYFRPLRFFTLGRTIDVAFDGRSSVFRIKKIRVGQTKGASSWDIDPHVADLREKLAAALPGMIVTIVTIEAEGQADLVPLGDYSRKSAEGVTHQILTNCFIDNPKAWLDL